MKVIRMRCDLCQKEEVCQVPTFRVEMKKEGKDIFGLDLCENCGKRLIEHLKNENQSNKNILDWDGRPSFL